MAKAPCAIFTTRIRPSDIDNPTDIINRIMAYATPSRRMFSRRLTRFIIRPQAER
jgi:hypothetical protein